ncbi:MAG TPA: DUF805 domain-containing protein [Xanthobacteraceae bacterium]|jgi:uncharacterized membrane protein YhaH (DUF805 family)
MDVINLFVSPEGRINRATYWIGSLSVLAVELALRLGLGVPFTPAPSDPLLLRALSFVIDLVLLYPAAMVMVKRLHDIDQSGFLVGWLVVPNIVLMITNLLGMTGDPNRMGVLETLFLLGTGVIVLTFLVVLGFRRGSDGNNQYGRDPLRQKR